METQFLHFTTISFVSGVLLLIFLERIRPYNREQEFFREGFFSDLFLYGLLQSYVLGIVIAFFISWVDTYTGISRWETIRALPVWGQVLLSLITHDFYIYWFHRWQHRNPLLWRIHEAHHSTPHVDWLSGARSHSLEIFINQTIEYLPIVLLCSPEVAVYKGVIDGLWGMYIHSNIDVRSGKLQYIINGPEMHRWHHANQEEAYDTNFSTKFAIWDWLFGTAFFPQDRKPQVFGISDENFPIQREKTPIVQALAADAKNYVLQHLYAFKRKS